LIAIILKTILIVIFISPKGAPAPEEISSFPERAFNSVKHEIVL
jgi:hypothetical protein